VHLTNVPIQVSLHYNFGIEKGDASGAGRCSTDARTANAVVADQLPAHAGQGMPEQARQAGEQSIVTK
jgi:hypothetical protein